MLITKTLRPIVLEGLHTAHQAVNGMVPNAHKRFLWLGLDAVHRLYRAHCCQCNKQAPSQPKEPAMESIQPELPFEKVAATFRLRFPAFHF